MVKPLRFMTGLVAHSSVAHNNLSTNSGDKIQRRQAKKWMCTNPTSNDMVDWGRVVRDTLLKQDTNFFTLIGSFYFLNSVKWKCYLQLLGTSHLLQ